MSFKRSFHVRNNISFVTDVKVYKDKEDRRREQPYFRWSDSVSKAPDSRYGYRVSELGATQNCLEFLEKTGLD